MVMFSFIYFYISTTGEGEYLLPEEMCLLLQTAGSSMMDSRPEEMGVRIFPA